MGIEAKCDLCGEPCNWSAVQRFQMNEKTKLKIVLEDAVRDGLSKETYCNSCLAKVVEGGN